MVCYLVIDRRPAAKNPVKIRLASHTSDGASSLGICRVTAINGNSIQQSTFDVAAI